MRITFLAHDICHVGGTIRATLNTAQALVNQGHDVEIAAVFRFREVPQFSVDPRIRVTYLVNRKRPTMGIGDRVRRRMSSQVYPAADSRSAEFNRLTDRKVAEFLRDCDADVIVGTRPGLNVYVSRFAPRRAVTVGQEHLFLAKHKPELKDALRRDYGRLDALVTVSAADAEDYRRNLPQLGDRVHFIPNSIVPTPLEPSNGDNKIVIAAGRMAGSKRFDMMVKAFVEVRRRHPDWALRIYGGGKKAAQIRNLVIKLGLDDSVSLMGRATPLDTEWVKGSIAAMTSKFESFGLTIVEAMNCGLPVVSTACDYGPPEIIDDGVDGLLTPLNSVKRFADALCELIEDEPKRRRMAAAALDKSRRYFPAAVATQYAELFTRLVATKEATPPQGLPVPAGRTVSRWRGLSTVRASAGHLATAASPLVEESVDCRPLSFEDVMLDVHDNRTSRMSLVNENGDAVNLPLGNGSAVRLDATMVRGLSEGIWTLHHDGTPARAGRVDSRALLRAPETLPSTVVVPYAAEGRLHLRVWRRDRYAEVGSVTWEADAVVVTGRLHGACVPERLTRLAARLRHHDVARHFPVETDAAGRFTARIAADVLLRDELPRPRDLWDLWLEDAAGGSPVRLARFFDDIAQRKAVQRFSVLDRDHLGATLRVRPYFTIDNELSVMVDPVPPK
ncbi:MAG TPA: glycosyltransferase family 4 protein [Stackebrandtia sp.]|jgi:glycosyltransferase involved in cell wall biosynthesis|uniref:glycosyltransferase family 4 protein n=1 Tax=Stackebrandtia sp. TaxID=2023065 RepID=UPI002D60D1A5|nr:glycosyltransferase family 4 protein [Stackebrandtia sp.]HZE40593.1 glycosyltransferase family 4 protein [Stackebrandtia sp.]